MIAYNFAVLAIYIYIYIYIYILVKIMMSFKIMTEQCFVKEFKTEKNSKL